MYCIHFHRELSKRTEDIRFTFQTALAILFENVKKISFTSQSFKIKISNHPEE